MGYLPIDQRPAQGGGSASVTGLLKWELFSGFDAVWEKREGEAKKLKADVWASIDVSDILDFSLVKNTNITADDFIKQIEDSKNYVMSNIIKTKNKNNFKKIKKYLNNKYLLVNSLL